VCVSLDQLYCGARVKALTPYRPYLIGPPRSGIDSSIVNTLNLSKNSRTLFDLSSTFGPDDTGAIVDAMVKLKETQIAVAGAATSVYSARMGEFGHAVQRYQDTLMAYRDVIKSGDAPVSTRTTAKQAAHDAFTKMQRGFQQELSVVTSGTQSRKGTPLTSVTRATNIARSSRSVAKLNVASAAQAHNLVKFSNYGKYLGNGLAVIDFTSRVGNVHNSYQSGGD